MAKHTQIEWTDATWNPITGCSLVSEGCRHCYAATLAATRLKHHPSRVGVARMNAAGEAKFTGKVRFNGQWLDQPLRWRKPRRVFVCAHGDLFHESVPDEWIDRVFAVMALAPQHTFQVLTKRPDRMREYVNECSRQIASNVTTSSLGRALGRLSHRLGYPFPGNACLELLSNAKHIAAQPESAREHFHQTAGWPLPNVWLGTSVEDQATANARIPDLLEIPAAIRWASYEPALGPVDLEPWLAWKDEELPSGKTWGCPGCEDSLNGGGGCDCPNKKAVFDYQEGPLGDDGAPQWIHETRETLDWIVAGGESGPHARPAHPDWFRQTRDQCAAADVPFLFKQWGAHAPASVLLPYDHLPSDADVMLPSSKHAAGRLLDGRLHDEFPEASS